MDADSSSPSDHSMSPIVPIPPRRKSRVSAEHTLNRVRENQRRHRARQRDHVATLEAKLAETERQLAEARLEIADLKAATAMCELNRCLKDAGEISIASFAKDAAAIDVGISTQDSNSNSQDAANTSTFDISSSLALTSTTPSTPHPFSLPDSTTAPFISLFTATLPLPLNMTPTPIGPPPCCSDPSPLPGSPSKPECATCATRPPPAPTESTTLCAQAYVMISQQNFRNLDAETIRVWLAQGLRRAQREGEGCRVENGALWRLLDYISGV